MGKTIAIVGASTDRSKYGNKCVRAYQSAGWTVFPVNLREATIEGLPAYSSLADVPPVAGGGELDRISVYLPPPVTLRLLPEIAARGTGELWLNPGSSDAAVEQEALRAGLTVRAACSIVDIGLSPAQFP